MDHFREILLNFEQRLVYNNVIHSARIGGGARDKAPLLSLKKIVIPLLQFSKECMGALITGIPEDH